MTTARERALEKKAVLAAERAAQAEAELERQIALDWQRGAKDDSRKKAQEAKELEKLRKKQELAALTAADDANTPGKATVKKKKKKGKDDCDELLKSLAAMPKTRAQREREKAEKEAEERRKVEEEAAEANNAKIEADRQYMKKIAARGIVVDQDLMSTPNNNRTEVLDFEDSSFVHEATGLDSALGVLSFATGAPGGSGTPKPEGSRKALFEKFADRMMPGLREQFPNLKLSQYKERIRDMWKNSPDNPANFQASTASPALQKSAATAAGIVRASSRSSLSNSPIPSGMGRSSSSGGSYGGCALIGAGNGVEF